MIDHSQEVYAKVDQSRQKYTISPILLYVKYAHPGHVKRNI